jgi:hypothetical protein
MEYESTDEEYDRKENKIRQDDRRKIQEKKRENNCRQAEENKALNGEIESKDKVPERMNYKKRIELKKRAQPTRMWI